MSDGITDMMREGGYYCEYIKSQCDKVNSLTLILSCNTCENCEHKNNTVLTPLTPEKYKK
jgi:hypothetical protein